MSEKAKRLPRLNVPASAGIWYTITSFIERGSVIIFTPIYTRLLLPEAYGVYSLYTSILAIATVIITLEISGGAVYRGLKEFRDRDTFISSALGLISISSIVFYLLYLIFSNRINGAVGFDTRLLSILFIQVFLNGIRSLKISEAKFFYDKKLPLTEAVFFSLIIPILTITLIIFYGEGKYAKIYAYALATFIFAVPLLISIIKRGKGNFFKKEIWKFLLKYTLPSLPHHISMSLIWQIGKIVVGNRFSSAEAGLMSIAISVGVIPTLLTLGMQSSLIPWITRKLSDGKGGQKRIYSLIGSVFFPLCFTVTLFLLVCPEIFSIISAKEYRSALGAVYPVAASVPLSFLSNLFSMEISYYKKTHLVALGSVIGAVFSVFFNLLFTFKLGYAFSAFLILPSFLIIFFSYVLILKRKFGHNDLPFKKILGTYSLFILSVALSAFLKISMLARVFLSFAVLLMIIPKIRELKPLISE